MTLAEIETSMTELSKRLDEAFDDGDHETAATISDEMDAMAERWARLFVEGADLS